MGDMSRRPGPFGGPDEHLADARHPDVRGDGLPASGDLTGDSDDLAVALAGSDPQLAAFLDRSADVLRAGPDELTARRHLSMMRREAAVVSPRGRGLRVVGIAAAAAVAAVVTLAGFGALPAPAQQVLSDAAERVGITLPSPADAGEPSFEVPTKQRPDPETVPGRPGGPDRSELPGLDEDGVLRTPGNSDGMTPGERSGEPGDTERGRSEEAPADRHVPEQPPAPDPPDKPSGSPDQAEDLPDTPEEPPSDPEEAPEPPVETPAPLLEDPRPPADQDDPAPERGSDTSKGKQDAPSQPSGR